MTSARISEFATRAGITLPVDTEPQDPYDQFKEELLKVQDFRGRTCTVIEPFKVKFDEPIRGPWLGWMILFCVAFWSFLAGMLI